MDVAANAAFLLAWLVLPLVALVVGRRRLRASGSHAVGPWSLISAAVGLVLLAAALAPVTSQVAERTFAAHMGQHLIVGLFAPLLIVAGRAAELLPWALDGAHRRSLRRHAGRLLTPPRSMKAPTVAMITAWYAWHVPVLYGAAVDNELVHVVEHLTILAAGLWFWSAVAPQRRRVGASIVGLFLVTISTGFLGATLSLSPISFYGGHVAAETLAGQLDDQHLGGLLMWTPGGLVYLLATVVQLIRWLGPDTAPSMGPPLRAPEAVS